MVLSEERNFGLKNGVPIQMENEAPLGPEVREDRGESIPSPSDSGVWEIVMSSPSGVQGGAPGQKRL